MSAPLVDDAVRARIRGDLDVTLVVEAAAGTGKTTMLVDRIIAVLRAGRGRLSTIAAVTFTEKAAGEMKLRLRTALEVARDAAHEVPAEQARLTRALAELEEARIGTIHSLCADLLHERPVEAEVDPLFAMNASGARSALYERAFRGWFQGALADPPDGVRRYLRRRQRGPFGEGAADLLRAAGWQLIERRDFTAPWKRPELDRDRELDAVLVELGELAGRYEGREYDPDDYLARNLREILRVVAEINARRIQRGGQIDYDGVEGELVQLAKDRSWKWTGGRRKFYGNQILRDDVVRERDAARAALGTVLDKANADLAASLREDLRPLVDAYEDLKDKAGELDFLDLLLEARDLVRGNADVRRELQERFTHLFVDEFQDTDPLQAEILLLLAADDPSCCVWAEARPRPGKLFVVGDPKQSIYRFRRADVALYTLIKERLIAQGAELLHLTTSFRSVPGVQGLVNAAFALRMEGGVSQAEYVPLNEHRGPMGGQPSVLALPVPRPYTNYGRVTGWEIDKSLPDAVGALVHWLCNESTWRVEEEKDGVRVPVPIQPKHVCLLFRRFTAFRRDVTEPYVRALEAREVPHVLVGGHSFHQRDEVLAVRNALTAIEWPSDELSVFATLHGPLFAVGDDALLAYRQRWGPLRPMRRQREGDPEHTPLTQQVAEALELLAQLHWGRNRRPIADTIAQLLEETRAHAGLAHSITGQQALANVLRLMDLARRFEGEGATSFRSFVEQLISDAERGQASDAPIVEEGTEGVRVMTVHRAKGLEFPIVVLCDPSASLRRDRPGLFVDPLRNLWAAPLAGCAPLDLLENTEESLRRDEEEGVRLAYVAATRARDVIVVPVVGDEEHGGWFDVLHPAIYPAHSERRHSSPALGCPRFGDESVMDRPPRARAGPGGSVKPGKHQPRSGEHEVVWWDPHALRLEVDRTTGLRAWWVLTPPPDPSDGGPDEGAASFDAWQTRRGAALEAGAAPTLRPETVTARSLADEAEWLATPMGTEVAEGQAGAAPTVAVERVEATRLGRPHGKRFGTLVHAVLADLPLDGDEEQAAREAEALAQAHARILGAPTDEQRAAAATALSALQHPLLRRAAAAERCLREVPIAIRRGPGTSGEPVVMEGIIDLAFREVTDDGARWVVVDFKTDLREDPPPEYHRQVGLYVEALGAATGEPAVGALLMV